MIECAEIGFTQNGLDAIGLSWRQIEQEQEQQEQQQQQQQAPPK